MAEIENHTLAWMRRIDERLDRIETRLGRMQDEIGGLRNDITVLTGLALRQEGAREGHTLEAAGILAKMRRNDELLREIQARLAALEAKEPV